MTEARHNTDTAPSMPGTGKVPEASHATLAPRRKTHQAVIIRGPKRASLEQLSIPRVNPGDVLIAVAYEGVCRTDLEIYDGTLGYYARGVASYPIVPGHEFSGWIAQVGSSVTGMKVGDPVTCECIQSCGACKECAASNWIGCRDRSEVGVIGRNGGYAEYVVAPARFVHQVPSSLDLVEAALCEPTAVVLKAIARLRGVHRGNLPKVTYCVAGAGPIGYLCAQVLALEGCRIAVFDHEPRRLQYFDTDVVETIGDVRECCEADVIVEATGNPDVLTRLLEHGRAGMTVLSLGLPYARREFSLENVVAYDKIVIGSVGSAHDDFDQALRLLPALNLDPFREHVIPFQEYRTGWTVCRQRDRLKTLLRVHA